VEVKNNNAGEHDHMDNRVDHRDSEIINPVRQYIVARDDGLRNVDSVSKAIAFQYDKDVFRRVIFTESHDTDVATRADGTDGLPCSGEIGIGPYTAVMFSQDE
jgi:hypothetical protein